MCYFFKILAKYHTTAYTHGCWGPWGAFTGSVSGSPLLLGSVEVSQASVGATYFR